MSSHSLSRKKKKKKKKKKKEQGYAEVGRQEVEEVRIHRPEDTDASETESLESEVSADEIPDVAPEEPEMRIPHM